MVTGPLGIITISLNGEKDDLYKALDEALEMLPKHIAILYKDIKIEWFEAIFKRKTPAATIGGTFQKPKILINDAYKDWPYIALEHLIVHEIGHLYGWKLERETGAGGMYPKGWEKFGGDEDWAESFVSYFYNEKLDEDIKLFLDKFLKVH